MQRLLALACIFILAIACPLWAQAHLPWPQVKSAPTAPATLQPPQAQVKPAPAAAVRPQRQLPPETRGDLLMAERQYMAAIKAYRQAPADSATVWNKMGIAWQHLFAVDQAKQDYERALRIRPNYPEAMNNLGTIYYAQKDYKQAEKLYRKALKSMPRSASVYNNLGAAYFAQGKFAKGAQAYQSAFAIDPSIFSTNSVEGIAALGSRQQQARQNYCLAELFARAGDEDHAIEYLRKAMNEGFDDRKRIKDDRDFSKLRNTPAFAQFMTEMKKQ